MHLTQSQYPLALAIIPGNLGPIQEADCLPVRSYDHAVDAVPGSLKFNRKNGDIIILLTSHAKSMFIIVVKINTHA